MGSSVEEGWVIQPPDAAGWSFHPPKDTGPQGYLANFLQGLAGIPAAAIAGVKSEVLAPSAAHVRSAADAASEGDPAMALLHAAASIPGSDYLAGLSGKATEALMALKQGNVPGAVVNAAQAIPGVQSGMAAQSNFVNRAEQQFAEDPTIRIATNPLGELHGNLAGMALLDQSPKFIPPALAALKDAASVRTHALNPTVGEAAAVATGAALGGPAGAKLAYGAMKVPEVVRAVREGIARRSVPPPEPTGLPDITGEPTGLPNKPITGVMPPEPPPVPAAEVPAASLADLVQQATRKPGTGIKFTTTAAEDAITELFNNNVKRKDAQTLLEDKFPDAHPETLKKIITEKYKEMIDKQRGKSTPEKPAPAEPPPAEPTTGRAWQEKNLKNVTDPVERERLIDEQSMRSAPPGYKLGTTISSKEPPPAIKALEDRNISGPEFKDLYWQIATKKPESPIVKALGTEVTPSKTGIDKPPLAKLSGRTADDIPATLEGNRMADYATFVNETVANYTNQVKIRAIDQETAIKKIQKETGATPSYAFYLFNKALKAQ